MDLLKREEAICLELGNKEGLQRCYGNQAEILRDLGRFEDAMVLLRQQAGVCEELGNKLALGYCYFGWGLTARALGNSEEGLSKLRAALTLFAELPMPRERDKVAAEITKTEAGEVS
jgi:tetratricopeptide (TPR) repeat protein